MNILISNIIIIIILIYLIIKYIPHNFNSKIYIEDKIPKLDENLNPSSCNLFCENEIPLNTLDELIDNEINKLETIGNINILHGGISDQEYGFEYNYADDNIDINKNVEMIEIDYIKEIDDNVRVNNNMEVKKEINNNNLESILNVGTPNLNSIVIWLHDKPIPEGWKVCDGTKYIITLKSGEQEEISTPNFIDKYIIV